MYNKNTNYESTAEVNKDVQFLINHGILDVTQIHDKVKMLERQKYLEMHPYAISQLKDGRWQTHFKDGEKGRIEKRLKSKEALEDYIVQFYKEQYDVPTVQECFDNWNDRRLRLNTISESTHHRYIQQFKQCFAPLANLKIKDLTGDMIQDFLEEQIAAHNLKAKSFSNLKTITRGMLKYAKKHKLIQFPVEEILADLDISGKEFKKIAKKDSEKAFTEEEYIIMLDYLIKNIDIHNLGILLMLVTGIRVGELVALKYSDFHNATKFQITKTETKYTDSEGKWHREIKDSPKTDAGRRIVFIPDKFDWILGELKKINPDGEYIFERNHQRMSTDAIRKRQYRICKQLHIPPKSPHKCRKSFISMMLDNHVDKNFILQQVGHTDISCSEKYYHENIKSDQRKKEILNDLPAFQAS